MFDPLYNYPDFAKWSAKKKEVRKKKFLKILKEQLPPLEEDCTDFYRCMGSLDDLIETWGRYERDDSDEDDSGMSSEEEAMAHSAWAAVEHDFEWLNHCAGKPINEIASTVRELIGDINQVVDMTFSRLQSYDGAPSEKKEELQSEMVMAMAPISLKIMYLCGDCGELEVL